MEMVVKHYCLNKGGCRDSLLKMPSRVPKNSTKNDSSLIFNIVMADVSGSMAKVWDTLSEKWSMVVAPLIEEAGKCKVYVFGNYVTLVREGSGVLQKSDFTRGGTNLTAALRTIEAEIETCKEPYVRVFLITDGHHYQEDEKTYPEDIIKRLRPPYGKTIEVYVLAIGREFPVRYSIDIRSFLHNGPSNIPYIFWANEEKDIGSQLVSIAKELRSGSNLFNLSVGGSILPGTKIKTTAFVSEWIFIARTPEELNNLQITTNDGSNVEIEFLGDIEFDVLVKETFAQWNSVYFKRLRCKEYNNNNAFLIMENQFKMEMERIESLNSEENRKTLKSRLQVKSAKTVETEYRTLMNQSKALIDTEKYRSEMELAELLVKTTISGKYEMKGLKYKGHTSSEYDADKKQFGEMYKRVKPELMNLPTNPDDCCRITASSTITDLQDPDFPKLLELNKFEFLKNFTVTGIAVLTHVKDSTGMNPWTIHIKNILLSPYEVLSQRALEFGAETVNSMDEDKSILLKQNDECTRFNAVIPIFPKGTVEILKPILTSKLFSICCTFSISKNVLIIDYECHIAALACVWLKTIHDYPKSERPEFIIKRIECIDEAAQIYKGRKGLKNYAKCLVEQPQIALMTDSGTTFQESNIRCEAIIKPTFLLHLYRDDLQLTPDNTYVVIRTTLIEFIGRCLTHYYDSNPFTYFFLDDLLDKKKRSELLLGKVIVDSFNQTGDELLADFYSPDVIDKYIKEKMKDTHSLEEIIKNMKIKINMKKIDKMKNSGSSGDVTWNKLKCWAREMNVNETDFDKLFSAEMITGYIYHVLKHKGSKLRMETPLETFDDINSLILDGIIYENVNIFQKELSKETSKCLKERWEQAYYAAHEEVVSPMTKDQMIAAANEVGVKVTSSNFDQIYKYRENVGLVRNACMCVKCPHYLQPHNTFNQHISVERRTSTFPHNLHNITASNVDEDAISVKNKISSENNVKRKKNKSLKTSESQNNIEISEDAVLSLIDKYAVFCARML